MRKVFELKSKILDIIAHRRSIRNFSGEPIENNKLKMILEAARLAPSSCNTQPWHFVVVTDRELIRKMAFAAPAGTRINKFLENAGAIIVCISEARKVVHKSANIVGRDNSQLDMGLAIEHMVLVATELGIGTCWIGWFSESKIKKMLAIPRTKKTLALLALGYPVTTSDKDGIGGIKPRPRKSLEEIVSNNKFGNPFKSF